MNDLICMMLQIGASDPALRRELGSIKNPTLIAFNDKIKGFEQARKMESSSAYGLAAKGTPSRCDQNPSNLKNTQCAGQTRGGSERSRRTALRGRCFRCAREDHMLPQCSYLATVSAISVMGQVIFRRLAGRGRQLTHPTHNSQLLQHLLLFHRCIN